VLFKLNVPSSSQVELNDWELSVKYLKMVGPPARRCPATDDWLVSSAVPDRGFHVLNSTTSSS
jgi:hypothetical protein